MQLANPGLTTTNTRKRKTKKNSRQLEAEQRHSEYLKSLGIHPDQLAEKKKGRPKKKMTVTSTMRMPDASPESLRGVAAKPAPKQYTGDKMLGIGQMHKSNAVPVFRAEDAADIARMRR